MVKDEFLKVWRIIFMMIPVLGFAQIGEGQTQNKYSNPLADTRIAEIDYEFSLQFDNNTFQTKSPFIISSAQKYPSLRQTFSNSDKTPSSFSQPKAYAYCDLAFFCKIEVQIEKAAKIPFKFRLGDVRYVDYLEQKIDSPK